MSRLYARAGCTARPRFVRSEETAWQDRAHGGARDRSCARWQEAAAPVRSAHDQTPDKHGRSRTRHARGACPRHSSPRPRPGARSKSGTNEGKISKTASTYLRALAKGDSARRLRPAHEPPRRAGTAPTRSRRARRGSTPPRSTGPPSTRSTSTSTATPRRHGCRSRDGARFALAKLGARWRIDSGYTLAPAAAVKIPATPLGRQVELDAWTSSTAAQRGSARRTCAPASRPSSSPP